MNIQEFYNMTGGDYQDILRRLQKEERIQKYLSKFLEDPSFAQLREAINQAEWETAFRASHSLKGICMNLGLTRLQQSSSALTENLRAKKADDQTALLFAKTAQDYDEICAILVNQLNAQ